MPFAAFLVQPEPEVISLAAGRKATSQASLAGLPARVSNAAYYGLELVAQEPVLTQHDPADYNPQVLLVQRDASFYRYACRVAK